MLSVDQQAIQARALNYLAGAVKFMPTLFGPDNRPLPPSPIHYAKRAAGTQGSLRNWKPRQLYGDEQAIRQREVIQARISDLVGSDPHAAGVANTFPISVIGGGLVPYPAIDNEVLGITPEEADEVERAQRLVDARFWGVADASGRMHLGQIQWLWEKSLIQYGESLTLVHMVERPGARYRLCLRVLNPMRVRTPRDMPRDGKVIDGVELDSNGEAMAVWIKKSEPGKILADIVANFVRVPVRHGHRWLALHDFIAEDPEQVRGSSPLASCLKGFRDLSQYLDAELVSNVVTAAFALFIELQSGANPLDMANQMASFWDANPQAAAAHEARQRYNELAPGTIMYGNVGEKPHTIAANRPGSTFQPFVREIKKAFAHGLGIPYPVLFKDVDGVSYSGFRSAMLEAWRVFTWRRQHHGSGNCAKVRRMLMEEAHLMGDLPVPGGTIRFYRDLDALCACQWYGPPKGDIEPYKQAKADFLEWDYNAKTLERIILENGGGNPAAVLRQAQKEKKALAEAGLLPEKSQAAQDSELGQGGEAAISEAVADALEERF